MRACAGVLVGPVRCGQPAGCKAFMPVVSCAPASCPSGSFLPWTRVPALQGCTPAAQSNTTTTALPPQVVEMAPAPGLDASLRQALFDDAVKLAKHVGYRCAYLALDAA